LLTEVSQGDVDELFTVIEKAQQMGIIVPSSEGPENPFTFAHELVRQTLLAGISAPRKQRMHAAVADAIELVYPRFVSERAGEIADHLLKAGSFADGRRLVRYLTLAGKNALEVAGFEEARRNFRSALSHKEAVEARERADLLASLAIAELSLEHWDAALTSLREALETARRGLDYLGQDISANRLRLLAVLGQASAASAGREKACEALREALDIASKLSDPKLE